MYHTPDMPKPDVFFVDTNTGLRARCARSQLCAQELPECACLYVDCVGHHVRDYVLYMNIFLVLYYLTLYYINICNSC